VRPYRLPHGEADEGSSQRVLKLGAIILPACTDSNVSVTAIILAFSELEGAKASLSTSNGTSRMTVRMAGWRNEVRLWVSLALTQETSFFFREI
jgi:hypothetical protein